MKLERAITGFWLARRSHLMPTTQQDYQAAYTRLLGFFGPDADFLALTTEDLARFMNSLVERGLAPKSRANVHTALSVLWKWGKKELGATQIVAELERPRFQQPLIVPFERLEIEAMLRACDHKSPYDHRWRKDIAIARATALRDRAILYTLVDTGIRASELTALLWGDYTESSGRMYIRHGKGDKARFVFVGDRGMAALWRYVTTRDDIRSEQPLFATASGQAMDRTNLLHLVQRIGTRAGVQRVHPHRFRHTFAIEFLRNGGRELELQRLLGHERRETIAIYVRLAEVDLQRASRLASPADGWRLRG